MTRGSFNGIANKFDKNIYGTTKGKLRHALLCHYLSTELNASSSLKVLDAGGGTGMMSHEFAQCGHQVTLVDVSDESLAIARQRLIDYPSTVFCCADIDTITERYDVIVCHALLEWLDDPLSIINRLVEHLSPNGVLSLSFFNQDAMLFNNAIYGNFDYIAKGMKVRNVVRLNPHNPQSPGHIIHNLNSMVNIELEKIAGIRCFHDYMRDTDMQQTQYEQIFSLEKEYGDKAPYMWLGKYFYIKIRKRTCDKSG